MYVCVCVCVCVYSYPIVASFPALAPTPCASAWADPPRVSFKDAAVRPKILRSCSATPPVCFPGDSTRKPIFCSVQLGLNPSFSTGQVDGASSWVHWKPVAQIFFPHSVVLAVGLVRCGVEGLVQVLLPRSVVLVVRCRERVFKYPRK